MTTEVSPPDVILLRSAEDPDPYVAAFEEVGFRAVCTPVLTFNFPNEGPLRKRLRTPERYGGVVATSPRVGWALHRVFDDEGTTHNQWEGRTAYAVGPKTADEFRALSFEVQGETAGTAADLADQIASADPETPLLFLCGNRRRDDLPNGLRNAGVAFEELVVYETRTRTDLSLPPPAEATWLAFFSPSGVEAVQRADAGPLDEYRCAAIGPTTASALEESGLTPEAVASSPTPDALVDAILGAQQGDSST
jgi:uroporphyrinogen-III synthase